MKSILPAVVILMVAAGVAAEEPVPELPFQLPVPEGWGTETIPFPLSFAPGLKYQGVEELRFAPGMFKVDQEDFWTYAFVWWFEPGPSLQPAELAADLQAYFTGLARAVAEDKDFDTEGAVFAVTLEAADPVGDPGLHAVGTAEIFDAFVTAAPLTLNARVKVVGCPEKERQAVIFELSPQPQDHAVWNTLEEIREGFRCR